MDISIEHRNETIITPVKYTIISLALFFLAEGLPYAYYAKYAGIAVLFFGILRNSNTQNIYNIFFIISNFTVFALTRGDSSFASYGIILMLLKVFSENKYFLQRIKAQVCLIFFIGTFQLLSILRYNSFENISKVLKWVIVLAYCAYVAIEITDGNKLLKAVHSYIFGAVVSGVYGFLLDFFFGSGHQITVSGGVFLKRFMGDTNDPNWFGQNIVIAVSLIPVLIIVNRTKTSTTKYNLVYYCLLIIALSCLSKMVTLVLIMNILTVFLISKRVRSIFLKQALILLPIIIVYLLLLGQQIIGMASQTIFRFETGDLTTGRIDAWLTYLRVLKNDIGIFIFGKGPGDYYIDLGQTIVAHNSYIQGLILWGITGFTLFLGYFKSIFKAFSKKRFLPYKFISALPIVTVLVTYFAIDGVEEYRFVLQIILAGSILWFDYVPKTEHDSFTGTQTVDRNL